jgi:hypothetical protein
VQHILNFIYWQDALGKAADDAATPVVKALLRLREIFPELILACDVSIMLKLILKAQNWFCICSKQTSFSFF